MASDGAAEITDKLQVLIDRANEKMMKASADENYEGRTGMAEMFIIALSAETREDLEDIALRVSDSLQRNDGILPKELFGDYRKLISHPPYDTMSDAVSYDIGYSVKTLEECISRVQDPDDLESLRTCDRYLMFLLDTIEDEEQSD